MADAPTLKDYRLAYLRLLQVTGEPWRSTFCLTPLAVLRDTIAHLEGRDPQDVQDSFESKARLVLTLRDIDEEV